MKNKQSQVKLSGTSKVNKGLRLYVAVVIAVTLMCNIGLTVYADTDPLAVANNLSDFIFGLIRAIGIIMLGFGIVQVGMSFSTHDSTQRSNGFLALGGGIVITFAKEILNIII